jgi:hypothetical protein
MMIWLQIFFAMLPLGLVAFLVIVLLTRRRSRTSLDRLPAVLVPYREELLRLARPCVYLKGHAPPKGSLDDPVGNKFGGVPYLAEGEDWPQGLALVAQINFQKVAEDLEKLGQKAPSELPSRGILQCFAESDPSTGIGGPWHIQWLRDNLPSTQSPPPSSWPPNSLKPLVLTARLGLSLPHPDDERDAPKFVRGNDRQLVDAYYALRASLAGLGWDYQLLGYANWIQGDSRFQQDSDGDCAFEDPDELRLLWQIGDDHFGDGGILYMLIRQGDLAAGHLDEVETFSEQS